MDAYHITKEQQTACDHCAAVDFRLRIVRDGPEWLELCHRCLLVYHSDPDVRHEADSHSARAFEDDF